MSDTETKAAVVWEVSDETHRALANNYVRNCFIMMRDEDASIFYATNEPFPIIVPRLDGYAIVPRDRYEALIAAVEEAES